jgi:fluoroquinolone transport system permease protein
VRALASLIRWDTTLQARNGFYWATLFIVVSIGALLAALPVSARTDPALWVPALIVVNLQVTTLFFMAALMLLERDEGVLAALAVSPLSPSAYLLTRAFTLTGLAALETIALIWVCFGVHGSWTRILAGTAMLGVTYTSLGAVVGARYRSMNALLIPTSVFVSLLLLPLIAHLHLGPRGPFLIHPLEPSLTLLRSGYDAATPLDLLYGVVGSVFWAMAAFAMGIRAVARLMRDTAAGAA